MRRPPERYGFRVLDVRSIGVARSFSQVLYSILVLRIGRPRAYEALKNLIPSTWGFALNTFDIIKIRAEKV